MAGKRQCLSFREKIALIEESEKTGLSIRKLAKKFNVGKTQVTTLLQNKEDIRNFFQKGGNCEQKRKFSKTKGLAVDEVVFNWFCEARNTNLPISGPIIRAKALETARRLGLDNFKASNGWLERFRRRHNIILKNIYGESANVNIEDVTSWKEKLATTVKDYAPRDVFNAGNTGLYYRALPTKTYALKDEKCTEKKTTKQRFTIMFCVNMDGEKEEPLIIDKSNNPQCFKAAHIDKLPLQWISDKRGWMTADIMTTWLDKFDSKMKKQNRRVVLLLDNVMSHINITLDNVKLIFLPPNTISHSHPLAQGIIHNFKMLYRSYLIKRLVTCIDGGCPIHEVENNIAITDALIWVSEAWHNLSPVTIKKGFIKAGFMHNTDIDDFEEEYNIPLAQLLPTIKDPFVNLKQFASIDDDLLTDDAESTIIDCIVEIQETDEESTSVCVKEEGEPEFVTSISEKEGREPEFVTCVSEKEEGEPEFVPASNISSLSEACASLRGLENFFINVNNFDMSRNISQLLLKCESEFYKNKLKNMSNN